MQAIILAGGLGTRLRPFTITVPKPLLPLGDQPIVDVVLRQLRLEGFQKIVMCLGYMAPLFQAFFGDGSRYGLDVSYYLEDEPLGTAGALLRLPGLEDDFIVLNGDTLTDFSFEGLLGTRRRLLAHATIFAAEVKDFVDYGVIEFDDTGRLKAYIEKPIRTYHVSTGIYALSREILSHAKPSAAGRLDMPDLLRSAQSAGQMVACHTQPGAYWRDIGRFDHYEAASKDFSENPERFFRRGSPA